MTWSGDRILLTGDRWSQPEVADTFLLAQHYVETIWFTRHDIEMILLQPETSMTAVHTKLL
jgi:hypothetical protein